MYIPRQFTHWIRLEEVWHEILRVGIHLLQSHNVNIRQWFVQARVDIEQVVKRYVIWILLSHIPRDNVNAEGIKSINKMRVINTRWYAQNKLPSKHIRACLNDTTKWSREWEKKKKQKTVWHRFQKRKTMKNPKHESESDLRAHRKPLHHSKTKQTSANRRLSDTRQTDFVLWGKIAAVTSSIEWRRWIENIPKLTARNVNEKRFFFSNFIFC